MMTVSISCDICRGINSFTMFAGPGLTPGGIKQALYDEGWRNIKPGWEHVCPGCIMETDRLSPDDRFRFLMKKQREFWGGTGDR